MSAPDPAPPAADPPAPNATKPPATTVAPQNAAFAFEKTGRKIAAELQWGLILGALLGFAALGALSASLTWWPLQTNRLIGKIYPHMPWQDGMGWAGYALAAAMLIGGLLWGVWWRRRFRRRFQRTYRL